ncbi:MAG TPA: hypothetical protein DC047_09950 [Blastocatellia bacterium]|nr:hypothetical protein [Blastocatellia bacterium]
MANSPKRIFLYAETISATSLQNFIKPSEACQVMPPGAKVPGCGTLTTYVVLIVFEQGRLSYGSSL